MKQKNKIFASIILATTFLTSNAAIAAPKENFTNVYSFGDSFTWADNSWAALITQRYGFKFERNKTNFSYDEASTLNLADMYANYKANVGTIDPNALFRVYMGPNDMERLYEHLALDGFLLEVRGFTEDQINNMITEAQIDANNFPNTAPFILRLRQDMGNFVKNLTIDGAKYIVVYNQFNPYYREGAVAGDDQLNAEDMIIGKKSSALYNKLISDSINEFAPSANVIYVDYARLVEEISNNPTAYLSPQDIAGTYMDFGLFVNNDPTPAASKIWAQYEASVIESPSRVAMVRELPIAVGTNALQTIHANAHNNVLHPVEQFYTADIGGDYIYNSTKTISKKEIGIKKADTGNAHAQINYKMNENFNLGLQLNGAKSKMDFKNEHGNADMKEYLVTINGTYKFDTPMFIYAAIGAGQIKYDIKRKHALGLATRVERGKPSGVHYLGTIGIGYNYIDESKLVVTPFFNVNYQEVSLKSYKEVGDIRSTTMEFNIPNRKSLITEIGATLAQDYQVQDNLTLIPSLTLSYGYECINTIKKHAKGRVSDMPRSFAVPTYKVNESNFTLSGEVRAKNDSYINYGVRASMQLTKRTKQYSAGLFAGVTF